MADEVKIDITIEEKQALQALTKLTRGVDKFEDSAKESFAGATKAFDVFKGALASAVVVKGFEAAGRAASAFFNTFVTEGIDAAQVQEDAINALNISLRNTGKFSEEASLGLQEFASELQATSKFGDELILETSALIQSLGNLETEGLKSATQAAADMSAALGIDLRTAATLVGKAAAGEVGSFSRYGLAIQKGATNAETFANVLDQLNNKFGGAAAGQIETFSGAFQQLQNTFGDLQEEFGFIITRNPAVIEAFKFLGNEFKELIGSISANRAEISAFISNGIIKAAEGFIVLVETMQPVADFLGTTLRVAFNVFSAGVNGAMTGVLASIEAVLTGVSKVSSLFGVQSENITSALDVVSEARRDYAEATIQDTRDITEALNGEESATRGLASTVTEFAANFVASQEAVREQRAMTEEQETMLSENKKNRKQEEFDFFAELDAQELARQQATVDQKKQVEMNEEEERFQFLVANLGREKALKVKHESEDLARQGKNAEARQKIVKANEEAEKKSLSSLFDFEKNTNAGRAANMKSTLGTISTLQQSNNSKLFAVGKAAAIATATIDGFAAVQKALASSPPPLNFALAGLVGTATAANVANIISQKPPKFQEGGFVPGSSFTGDSQLIRANSGEFVANNSQQRNILSAVANGTFGGGSGVKESIDNLVTAITSQPIIVKIDEAEIARATRNASLDGFSIA